MGDIAGYRLEKEIGAGSSGSVWRAVRDGPVAQPVALKRLRAATGSVDVQRLRREAAVLSELDHPHIVRVFEVLEDGEGIAIAMQLATGGSLEALLAERGALGAGEVVAVAAPLANALASAHRRGTVHGDVKPANILFTSDGEPLLSDFGSARSLGLTTSDNLAATPDYVAPELLEGATPDERSDIYSLAVVCYHTLAGRPPFEGDNALAVIRAADQGSFVPLADRSIPPDLARVVEQAMARSPEDRPATADEFARQLADAIPGSAVQLPGVPAVAWAPLDDEARSTRTFGPRPPRDEATSAAGTGRRRLGLIAGVIVVLGGIALLRGPLAASSCPEARRPTAGPESQVLDGDIDGEGCDVYLLYEPAPPDADDNEDEPTSDDQPEPMQFSTFVDGEQLGPVELGSVGDQVVLGDWNCDGADTLAHYLPEFGELYFYDDWPTPDNRGLAPVTREVVEPDGNAELVAADEIDASDAATGSDACEWVEIVTADDAT